MKALRWLGRQLFPLLLIVWANGLVLRLTVRDSVDRFAPLYYATPWPVLAALVLPLVWRVRRQPQMVFGAIVLTHVMLAMWIMEDWRSGQPSRAPADFRVVHWNVARPVARFAGVAQRLRETDADLISLAEPEPRVGERPARWDAELPGYASAFAAGNMMLFVRGEILSRSEGSLDYGSYYAIYDVRIKGRDLRVLQGDVQGIPTMSRRKPLARVAELAATLRDRPLLMIGDLNTPRHSVHFAPLRRELSESWEVAGFGPGDTWPWPLPVLSLDHIWFGKGLNAIRSRNAGTLRSDHKLLTADFVFEPAGTGQN